MRSHVLFGALLFSLAGCSSGAAPEASGGEGAITTNAGAVLDFRFQGEVLAASDANTRVAIVSQLQYVQGLLTTTVHGNGQVGLVTLTDVAESARGDKKKITYAASLPVIWPKDGPSAPANYELVLPRDVTALDAFNDKYDGKCGTNEYGRETFWHDFDAQAAGCKIDDADVVRAQAKVGKHAKETREKYPEYGEIWKDDALEVVALYGIVDSGGDSDPGYTGSERLLRDVERLVKSPARKSNPTSSSILRDTTLTGEVTVGGRERSVKVTAIVVQDIEHLGDDFDERYDPLSETADIIFYGGHSGLGKNVASFAARGKVVKQKYQLAVLNGCQTFAYLQNTMNQRRVDANGAALDPLGTKYLDVFANALPSFASTNTPALETFVRAAIDADHPKHYNQLLEETQDDQLPVVFGEEDNTFSP
jgi:hypothetical protein